MSTKLYAPHVTPGHEVMSTFPQPARTKASPAGQSLDPLTRREMESRFHHDFSGVRVHSGAGSAGSASALDANAYTVGQHIVFDTGRYEPHMPEGRRLLAHELAHVVQQSNPPSPMERRDAEPEARVAARRVATADNAEVRTGVRPGTIQRDNGSEEEEEERFRLRPPQLGESLGFRARPLSLGEPGEFQLRIDPEIQAQIRAMRMVRGTLSLESLETAVSRIGTATPSPEETEAAPDLSPRAAARSAVARSGVDPFSLPSVPEPEPLVPAGRGPATPRAASVGDVLGAVLAIPAVRTGVERLQEAAEQEVRRSWSRLSAGERALVITHGVLLGAGALTGIALSPEARQLALDQIQGRDIPIPGMPVTFNFNLTGDDQRLMIGVNVGEILPPSLGFR